MVSLSKIISKVSSFLLLTCVFQYFFFCKSIWSWCFVSWLMIEFLLFLAQKGKFLVWLSVFISYVINFGCSWTDSCCFRQKGLMWIVRCFWFVLSVNLYVIMDHIHDEALWFLKEKLLIRESVIDVWSGISKKCTY